MHERRSHIGGSCVEVEGMLYVVGGCRDGCPLRSVEKYDPIKDQWSFVTLVLFLKMGRNMRGE